MHTNRLLVATMLSATLVAGSAVAAATAITDGSTRGPDPLRAYAADVPLALAAPTWLPPGFVLLDGDGPWTRVDLDGDGEHESVRAEIMYGPADTVGMAPVMTSQESGHRLDDLAGGYRPVQLPDGTPAWLSVRDDSPWLALQWNVDGVTRGIQARDVTVEQVLRIAASFAPIGSGTE